ncbi:hypothetical protein ACOSP6_10875 [Tenacibaculum sp. MEBiC06402]|uniref:hypothetical protein n=1 Tax=unclassified Tenacibaculum TaxID=2635139 RepID=UPI003B9C59D3
MKTRLFKQTNSGPTKTILPTQIITEERSLITAKSNKKLFFKDLLIATVIASLFYCFEFIPNFSEEYLGKIQEHKEAKAKRTDALNELKSYVKTNNFDLYSKYSIEKKNTDKKFSEFKEIQEKERVFGFKSLQLFATALFPVIAIFFYVLYNLIRSYKVEEKNIGIRVIHYVVMMFCFFQFFWIFKTIQDYPKYVYYLCTLLSTYFVGLAVYIIHKQENKLIQKLRNKLFRVSLYSLRYADENKKEEMAKIVEEPL